jgi:diadenosine tetraphosphate (Ap4A) HIT family hydrolase
MASTAVVRDQSDCALCTAADGVTPDHFPAPVNRVLLCTEHFVVVPALGPLVPGHALVVGRRHAGGLLTTADRVQTDYQRLAARLRAHCVTLGAELLELEHGGATAGGRGPCIDHTHVHLLPGLGHCLDVLEGRLPRLTDAPRDTAPFRPYMWLRNAGAESWYDAAQAIGQEARRAIGHALHLDDWDWAVNPGWQTVEETIDYWTPHTQPLPR